MDLKNLQLTLSQRSSRLFEEESYVKYSVMIPIIQQRDGRIQILFEKRAATLKGQPGEICFPGGRFEEGDQNPWETARRETCEELGIEPDSVQYLGQLDYIITHSRRIIYPFIGFIRSGTTFCENPDEVEEIYLLDLEKLMSVEPEFHHISLKAEPSKDFPLHLIPNGAQYEWRAGEVTQAFFIVDHLVIWGLTARILNHFLQVSDRHEAPANG
jgi:coenzyme A diphosphatase NUDT7